MIFQRRSDGDDHGRGTEIQLREKSAATNDLPRSLAPVFFFPFPTWLCFDAIRYFRFVGSEAAKIGVHVIPYRLRSRLLQAGGRSEDTKQGREQVRSNKEAGET